MPFSSTVELSDLDGTDGFIINGANASDYSGRSVSSAGDINGDGIDDVIIGAGDAGNGAGEGYVVFGRDGAFDSDLNLASLDGTNGFVINGVDDGDFTGDSVSGLGDVNGDGIDDIIIGSSYADLNSGESYVVFGSSGFGSSLDLDSLNGINGFVINGIDADDRSGVPVSGAGDINGDGVNDIIIGASGADPNGNFGAGESYVVFGSSSGFGSSLDLAGLNGTNGFVINGIDADDSAGGAVSGAGDINGDGINDIIIGASGADPNGNFDAGESYVVFGSSSGFGSSLDLADLNGTNGFVINGIDAFDYSGGAVSGAGDINGDGIDDIIIGARYANLGSGESYVVFGSSSGFGSSLDLASLDGTNGIVINGIDAGDSAGSAVSGAGDFNGDGIDDVIIGASGADPNGNFGAGESYVVFGSSSGFGSSLDLASLDGTSGIVINGIDTSDNAGGAVSGAGDFNGDGTDDVITGALFASPSSNSSGQSYLVFGGVPAFSGSLTANDDTFTGSSRTDVVRGLTGDDQISGEAGDDILSGNGGRDRLFGGAGNDLIRGGFGSDRIRGGRGNDRIRGGVGDDHVVGGAGRDVLLGNRGDDQVFGNAGRDRIIGGFGEDQLTGGNGSDTFVYRGIRDQGDVITDFEVGTDVIDISTLLRRAGQANNASPLGDVVQISQGSDGAIVTVDRDGINGADAGFRLVTLAGVAASDLSASDFTFAASPLMP